jgi:hypothetical protein
MVIAVWSSFTFVTQGFVVSRQLRHASRGRPCRLLAPGLPQYRTEPEPVAAWLLLVSPP